MDISMVESKGPLSEPADLEKAIKRRIVQRTGGRIRTLEVEVVGTCVVIRGRVSSFHLKQLAIQGAMDVLRTNRTIRIDIGVEVTVQPPRAETECT